MQGMHMMRFLETMDPKRRLTLALVLIAALTLAVYWPALQAGFIDYDDTDYVTLNMAVRQGLTPDGVLWAFKAFHAGNWHPLTWLSHMLDVELFDLNPAGHHAVNLLLHGANALLLCLLLHRLTGRLGPSLLVALLFAVHPLHVESVAWVSERKDLLSTLFWLLALWAYQGYARQPELKRYLAVALCFALGLLSKQMVVTLPLVLLLLDFWPLERLSRSNWKGLVLEKLPLLALSLAAALITISSQSAAGALSHGRGATFLVNCGNALLSYLRYLRNTFWPVDLALFYPFDAAAVTPVKVGAALALLLAVSVWVLLQAGRRPYLALGWFWYLVTLLPVIGFLRAGEQAMADRYTYIPLIGIFLVLAWGGAELAAKWRGGATAAAAAAAVVVALLGGLCLVQVGYWRNSYDLFAHALSAVPRNWLAHNNMGILMARQFRQNEAIFHFSESVRINPEGVLGYRNLGTAYQSVGNLGGAVQAFQEALRIDPRDAETRYRLGYAYLLSGNPQLAYQQYLELERLAPAHAAPLLDSIRMMERRP